MQCWYMNGAGNDFMVIDARGQKLDFSTLAVELCTLTGADGFMATDVSGVADFRLHFYNSDGSRGEMCGNGSRCICRFAFDNGIAGENMTVQTDAGIVYGKRLSENQYVVKLNDPSVLDVNRKEDVAYIELGDPGVPHAVKEVPGLCWEMGSQLWDMAKALRHDPAFPKGANVNLYSWIGENTVRILTFERGVEDYTLACGTGSASTALTLWKKGELPSGELMLENRGGLLKVSIRDEGIYLEGPTEVEKIYEI